MDLGNHARLPLGLLHDEAVLEVDEFDVDLIFVLLGIIFVLAELVVQCSKQQTDGGEPLLAVDKLALGHALFCVVAMVDDDDRAEEITLVIVGNVVEEVLPVALGPGVLALVARHIKHEG